MENREQFPRSITRGPGEGFWWAFVTMTTVGLVLSYGQLHNFDKHLLFLKYLCGRFDQIRL